MLRKRKRPRSHREFTAPISIRSPARRGNLYCTMMMATTGGRAAGRGFEINMSAASPVIDNEEARRFEINVDGHMATANYERAGRQIIFTHTETPAALRGRGIGSLLARSALDEARARGLEVVPLCPFIAGYIRAHPEYLDLVSERDRARLNLERTS